MPHFETECPVCLEVVKADDAPNEAAEGVVCGGKDKDGSPCSYTKLDTHGLAYTLVQAGNGFYQYNPNAVVVRGRGDADGSNTVLDSSTPAGGNPSSKAEKAKS